MSVQIGNIDLRVPLLLAPMEDVSDPPFRYVCKQRRARYDVYRSLYHQRGLIRDAAKMHKAGYFELRTPYRYADLRQSILSICVKRLRYQPWLTPI